MIKIKTCLVLGAGASVPYGFPSGQELRKKIRENISNQEFQNILSDSGIHSEKFIDDFRSALNKSKSETIDKFLACNPDYLKIGKLSIAYAIVRKEYLHNLIEIEDTPDRWYTGLWNQIITDNPNHIRNNELRIITFNYDRSLEYFLYISHKHLYSYLPEDAHSNFLNMLDIVHIHGKLGNLPWEGNPSRPYTPKISSQEMIIASDKIRIMSEYKPKKDEINFINQYLSDAKRIFFLGFGYDENNLINLGIDNVLGKENKEIFGTAFKLGKAQIESIQSKRKYIRLAPNNIDAANFFKDIKTLE